MEKGIRCGELSGRGLSECDRDRPRWGGGLGGGAAGVGFEGVAEDFHGFAEFLALEDVGHADLVLAEFGIGIEA